MENKLKKKWYKKWWVWVLAIIIIGAATSGGGDEAAETAKTDNSTQQTSTTNTEPKKEEPKKEEPKKEEPKKDDAIKAGQYKVGTDIQAGEYVIVASGMGYMEITKDSSGTFESIMANENIATRTLVTIQDGEYFTVKNGKIYAIDKAAKVEPKDNKLPEGMYKVGVDIQAGEYKISSKGSGYVEVSNNSRHTLEGIASNDNFEGEKYITIQDGQYLKLVNAELTLK